jgi:hypothetical protein
MKRPIKYIASCLLFFGFTACNLGVSYDDQIVGDDSLSRSPELIPMDPEMDADVVEDELSVVTETMDIESFQNLFSEYFDHPYDFGWRYITANYDE